MKKFVAGLVLGFLLTSVVGVFAVSNISLIVNGQEIIPDVPPQIIDGRVMVPARFVAEPLGAIVEWDEKGRAIIVKSATTAQIEKFSESEKETAQVPQSYYNGRTIIETLASKYPDVCISGLGGVNFVRFRDQEFVLPIMVLGDGQKYWSIQPLIDAGLISTSDFD